MDTSNSSLSQSVFAVDGRANRYTARIAGPVSAPNRDRGSGIHVHEDISSSYTHVPITSSQVPIDEAQVRIPPPKRVLQDITAAASNAPNAKRPRTGGRGPAATASAAATQPRNRRGRPRKQPGPDGDEPRAAGASVEQHRGGTLHGGDPVARAAARAMEAVERSRAAQPRAASNAVSDTPPVIERRAEEGQAAIILPVLREDMRAEYLTQHTEADVEEDDPFVGADDDQIDALLSEAVDELQIGGAPDLRARGEEQPPEPTPPPSLSSRPAPIERILPVLQVLRLGPEGLFGVTASHCHKRG